jgi:7-cyano-7-deazaguanine synthase
LDSATALAIAKQRGYDIYALSVNYNQRHSRELKSALAIGRHFKVREHKIIGIDLRVFGGSALTSGIKLPSAKTHKSITSSTRIPVTYVPARNTIFLSIALAYAETVGAQAIFIGANSIDYSGYPDCRPEYFKAFQRMASLATKCGVEGRSIRIQAPLVKMRKEEIVKKAILLRVPLKLTWSCYSGGKKPCGTCDSCVLRREGFKRAGLTDPVPYAK